VIAGHHVDGLFITVKMQLGFALQDNHPFAVVLVVPEPFGTRVTVTTPQLLYQSE